MSFVSGFKNTVTKVEKEVEAVASKIKADAVYTVETAAENIKWETDKLKKLIEEKAEEEADKLKQIKVLQEAVTFIQAEAKKAQELIAKLTASV